MVALGSDLSSKLLKQLSNEEIEKITYEIANMGKIDQSMQQKVIEDFLQLHEAREYLMHGGIKYAREVLEKSLGAHKANEIIKKLVANTKSRPFSMIRKTDPKHLVNFIQNEHPQTIALILSYIEPEQAAVVLNSLPEEKRSDIAKRIAMMDRTPPEVIREIESVLEKKLSSIAEHDFAEAGGINTLVEILNRVDRSTEKVILEDLEAEDVELAEEVRKRLFVFEDIITLDDASIRRLLQEIDMKDLPLALKGASDEVTARIFKNLSKRAGEMLREDIEFLGPVRLRDVEEAQQRIVNVIRQLEESGEIIISRGGEDTIVV
ncbi:MAG: flagellar motor switch protein FliG [Thermoanaerobacteraceae bacterium]|nr:flagellar motor switch protein FliG [Thermoanaerobacteraceae bacterium]